MTLRQFAYITLEHTPQTSQQGKLHRYTRWFDWFLILLIITNTVAVILESIDAIYLPYQTHFHYFEQFSVSIFALEYLARFWAIAERNAGQAWKTRIKWCFSVGAIIDLCAILPTFLSNLHGIDLRFLRVLRLIRLLKLTRYFTSLQILLRVFEKERGSFGAVIFILVLLIILSASGIYLVEYDAQPTEFNSIPHAMWWAVVTLTTVGYGDITPITPLGKILGAFITILGVGLAALPAGILATGLTRELESQKQAHQEQLYDAFMALSLDELHNNDTINTLSDHLNVDRKNRHEILTQVLREKRLLAKEQELEQREHMLQKKCFCPYCGEKI